MKDNDVIEDYVMRNDNNDIIEDYVMGNNDNKDNDEKCAICIDNIKEDKNLVITECKHKYHFTCILKFIKIQLNKNENFFCPLCKKQNSDEIMETTSIYRNTNDINNTIQITNNNSRYLGNIRASRNNYLGINIETGLWDNLTSEGDYIDNISDIESNTSNDIESNTSNDDFILDNFILNLRDEINT
jgi:hypothetical protein